MNDTFYDHIPEDQAQQLIQSAAIISGKPAAEMTIQDAAQILEERGIKMPAYNPNIDKAAAMLWHTMDTKQLKRILSADTGNLETAFSSVIDELAQKAQEAIPAQDAQEIKTFDAKIWEEAGGHYEEIRRALNDRLQAATEPAREILTGTVAEISKAAREAFASITEIVNSEAYKAIREKLQEVGKIIEEYRLNYKELAEASEALEQLIPFIQMELDAAQDDPAFTGCTLEDVIQHGIDDDLQPTDSKYRPIIERALQRQEEHRAITEAVEEIEQAAEKLPQIIANPTEKVDYPVDKPNSVIWSIVEAASIMNSAGQMQIGINTSKDGSNPDQLIYISLISDDLDINISKNLTPFDKRCYIAAAALYNAGNAVISTTQLYYMMGGQRKNPNAEDKRKIEESLLKMGTTRIFIDNEQEIKFAKNYVHFKYDASLLPFERTSAYINGKYTDSAIHLFREPPLISFAKEHNNQITTIPRKLLASPQNKTDENLRIEDYLIERIAHIKNPKFPTQNKTLYSTIFEACNIKGKQRQRAKKKIHNLLEYYKSCSWIIGYTESEDGITIDA